LYVPLHILQTNGNFFMPAKKTEFVFAQLPRQMSWWTGTLLIALASIVMLGWLVGLPLFVRVMPHAAPMRFNTALCLGLIGLALLDLSRSSEVWGARLGGIVLAFATLTLSQDVTGVSLGIDQILLLDSSEQGGSAPGRMAVNTAIAFVLTGLTLVSLGSPRRSRWQPVLECVSGGLVFAISAVSAFGYLSGLADAYGWGGSVGMAIHTSGALMLTGLALIGLALAHHYNEHRTVPRWLPLPAIVIQIAATLAIAHVLYLKEIKEIDSAREERVGQIAHLIGQEINFRRNGVFAFARCPKKGWDAEATAYFQDFSDCISIARLSPNGKQLWHRGKKSVDTTKTMANVWEQVNRQLSAQSPPKSRSFLIGPRPATDSTWMIVPVFKADFVAEWLFVEFDTPNMLLKAVPADWLEGYEWSIRGGDPTLTINSGNTSANSRTSEAPMNISGLDWRISLVQPWGLLSGFRGPLPWAIIARSIFVALTIALAIHFAQRSLQHWIDAEALTEELRRTQARFRAVFDQTFQFIGLLDVHGTVLDANRTALQFAGISEDEVIGKPFWETPWWTQSPADQARLRDAIHLAAAGETIRFETTHPSPSGETITVDFSLKPFRDDLGNVTLLIPEGRDITTLKRAQQRATQVIEQAPSGLLLVDQAGKIVLANAMLERLFGYEREELIGKPVELLLPKGFRKRQLGQPDDSFEQTIEHETVANAVEYGRHRDGRLIPVELGLSPIMTEDGPAVLGSAIDISARLAAEELLRQSEQRMELAIRGSSDGIWDWNLTTGAVYYSPRYKQLLGYTSDDFLDHLDAFHDHLHPEDAGNVLRAIEANLERAEPYQITYRMRTKSGEWRWFHARGDAVRDADGKAQRMAGSMSDVTDEVLAEHELTRRARFDKLTGLPNRLLILDRLQIIINRSREAMRSCYAVMFLDFDRFKQVNDSLGHDVGDALLQGIAHRLEANIRSVDSVSRFARGNSAGRLGGDEFVVLLDDLRAPEDALAIADRLMEAFAEVYKLGEHEVYSTASIGIVMGNLEYERADDILRDADIAMYEAKRTGKARYVVFDEAMQKQAARRLRLEFDLRKAIDEQLLELNFEPLVSLSTGELLGVESHICWLHPLEGEIAFQEFLPLAEESNLIHAIGEWAIQATCQKMREWLDELGTQAPHMISLRVSHKQFAKQEFTQFVKGALAAARLPANRLQLQLPESVLTGNVEEALITMHKLRELDVRLALDDFGAGRGSFALLHRLPIEMIRVDSSLHAEIESCKHSAALLHALAVLVRNLGIALVAVAVRSRGQCLALQELGCSAAQGQFVAPRQNSEQIMQYLISDRDENLLVNGTMTFSNRLSEFMSVESI
jgi:diguanylate cyclase (GGDEF)-like protein/PAS domain S-box-containing protein